MTKKELSQLYWLNREIEADKERLAELDREIEKDEMQLDSLEQSVSSPSSPRYDGMPKSPSKGCGLENAVIKIVELKNIIERKKLLRCDCAKAIHAKLILCLTERNKLENYIKDLPDSLLRMAFTLRFINGLTWAQVSEHIGAKTTEESVKKMCYRYLAQQDEE